MGIDSTILGLVEMQVLEFSSIPIVVLFQIIRFTD